MFKETEIEKRARELWSDFKNHVFYKNRFFISHPLLDMVREQAQNNTMPVDVDKIYYRARIIDENALVDLNNADNIYKESFKCLSKKGSFIPRDSKKVQSGRANPQFITYLYVAEHITTALLEVRPLLSDKVNLAEIKVISPLQIANLSAANLRTYDEERKSMEDYILYYIQLAFSVSTHNPNDYIPSQIIAEYLKNLGYDGIKFNSSLHKGGANLTIFNVGKCEPIKSRLFIIDDVKITARSPFGIDPKGEHVKDIVDNCFKYYE